MTTGNRFVWIETDTGRLVPERWPADAPDGATKGRRVVATFQLDEYDMKAPLSHLIARFPCPPKS